MKLIKLQDKFILLSDEEIKGKGFRIDLERMSIGVIDDDLYYNKHPSQFKKIITGIPELPSIDFSLLSEEDCKRIGYIDIEKLAMDKTRGLAYGGVSASRDSECFIWKHGFKTAQSLNDKMFSLEQMIGLLKYAHNNPMTGDNQTVTKNYIQSLQQTSWDVEVERDSYESDELVSVPNDEAHPVYQTKWRPKIKNNSIKVIKIL